MKQYAIYEMFLSLQGEGAQSGRRAVFCRFTGCNGWSGLQADRGSGPMACSAWCDTDFVGTDGTHGGHYHAVALAQKIAELWASECRPRFVVLTGGEPMLQVDAYLVDVLHRWECELAIETNGTIAVPSSMDWITVSPKPGRDLVQTSGEELKLVYPQSGVDPKSFESMAFRHFFLQPRDGPDRESHLQLAVQACLSRPPWRLSLQSHKVIGVR